MKKEFYIVPEDVFRVGNAGSPRMHMIRASEIDLTDNQWGVNGWTTSDEYL